MHDFALTTIGHIRHAGGMVSRGEKMSRERPEHTAEDNHHIKLRWKVMLALSAVLIVLGLCIDWSPPQDAGLPDTSSFLVILGILLGLVGLLTATRR